MDIRRLLVNANKPPASNSEISRGQHIADQKVIGHRQDDSRTEHVHDTSRQLSQTVKRDAKDVKHKLPVKDKSHRPGTQTEVKKPVAHHKEVKPMAGEAGRLERIGKLLQRDDILSPSASCRRRLPDSIVIGVMKSGTEAFQYYLTLHPKVAMSIETRAVMFFSKYYHMGFTWYRKQMMCSTEDQVTMEKSPQYFVNLMCPERIFNMNPKIKLILIVRNPIERAVSHYLNVKNVHPRRVKNKFENMAILKNGEVNRGCPFIQSSMYSIIIKGWLKYFPLEQIHIVDGDILKTDPVRELVKTERFLGIKHYLTKDRFVFNAETRFYCIVAGNTNETNPVCLSSGKGRSHPKLPSNVFQTLKAFFKPYNEEFYKITDQKFNWS